MASRASYSGRKAYVITGPTSGIGKATAFEVARYGTVILVGRNRERLDAQRKAIEARGGLAVSVVCDLADTASVRRAAAEIISLGLPIAGLVNNAGISHQQLSKSAQGWDLTFATNHLGPFALMEALIPHLPDGANVVSIVSAVEDPERRPAKIFGLRGSRYISAEASARGEWEPGGAKIAGADAYATSKQCLHAATLAFAREVPRLHFNVIEPGITPATGLSRDMPAILRSLFKVILLFPPFRAYTSTPERAAQVITRVLLDESGTSGVYYGEKGQLMEGSAQVRDERFQDRVVAETRALLAAHAD